MHIIIVDAYDDYLQMLRAYLGRYLPSATITCVHSAEAALTAYAFRGADLVITAYLLPQSSGVELVQELRRQTQLLPIIMNTTAADIEAEAYAAGVDGFVVKGASLGNLVATVKEQFLFPV